jgi:outer membrane protein TolC
MKRINILFIFIFSVPSATFSQQSDLLEKYRSMAVEYNHDLKAADKHISASIELEKAARKDLRPKLSGDANFQYTGNPIQLTLDLPSMQNPLTFEGKDMKYGASLTLYHQTSTRTDSVSRSIPLRGTISSNRCSGRIHPISW